MESMIPQNTLESILVAYGIGTFVSMKKIEEGVLNHNFLLETSKGSYFIKSNTSKIKPSIQYTETVEKFMLTKGIPVIAMLPTNECQTYLEIDGNIYMLYPFVKSDRSHKYSRSEYEAMGKMLGCIHKAGSENIPQIFLDRSGAKKEREVEIENLRKWKEKIEALKNLTDTDRLLLKDILFKLNKVNELEDMQPADKDTLIHGDYHAGNLLFDKETRKLLGVCDWDKAMYSFRAYELSRAIMYICFPEDFNLEHSYEVASFFIKAYQNEYPIEKEKLAHAMKYRAYRMAISSWIEDYYYNGGSDRANHFIDHEISRIELFTDERTIRKVTDLLN